MPVNDTGSSGGSRARRRVRWLLPVLLAAAAGITVSYGLLSASPPSAAGIPTIARWHNDATAAVSFTFDDGLQCHRDKALPLLDAFGIKATFYVIAGKMREHRSDPPIGDPRFKNGEAALSWDDSKIPMQNNVATIQLALFIRWFLL